MELPWPGGDDQLLGAGKFASEVDVDRSRSAVLDREQHVDVSVLELSRLHAQLGDLREHHDELLVRGGDELTDVVRMHGAQPSIGCPAWMTTTSPEARPVSAIFSPSGSD